MAKALPASHTTSNFNPHQSVYSSKSRIVKTDECKPKKEPMSKERSRQKTVAVEFLENHHWNKSQQTANQSTEKEEKFIKKDTKSSLDKTQKSKTETRKKGISLCSQSTSKQTSLSKKRNTELDTADSRDLNSRCEQIKKLKPVSRSCSEKYEKGKRLVTQ